MITIKPCNKGAGIIILKFESYMESCLNELSNQQMQENGTLNPYYVQVEEKEVEETNKQIKSVLDIAADTNIHKCTQIYLRMMVYNSVEKLIFD